MSNYITYYSMSLDPGCVVLAQAKRHVRKQSVTQVVETDSVEDEAFVSAWASAKLDIAQGKAIWIHPLASPVTLFRRIPTPLASERKAREILPSLLDVQLPFDLEEASHDIEEWNKSSSGTMEASVSAVQNKVLQEELGQLNKQFGIEPHHVTHEMLALRMLDQSLENFSFETHHLIFLFRTSHVAVLLIEENKPSQVWVRRTEDMSQESLKPLMDRLERVLNQRNIKQVGVTPVGSRVPPEASFKELLDRLSCVTNVQWVPKPETCLAVCAAMRGLQNEEAGNLRNAHYPHPDLVEGENRHLRRAQNFLLVLTSLFIAACLIWMSFLEHTETRMRSSILTFAQQLAPTRRIQPGLEVITVERQLESSQGQRKALEWMAEGGAIPLLNDLFYSGLAGTTLSKLVLSPEDILVTGQTENEETPAQLAQALKSRGWISELETEPNGTGESFQLRGQP